MLHFGPSELIRDTAYVVGSRTYRDSFSSNRPKHDDSPASFISGEKLILAGLSGLPSLFGFMVNSLVHLLLSRNISLLHLLEHLPLFADRFDRVRLELDMDALFGRRSVGEAVGEVGEESIVKVLHLDFGWGIVCAANMAGAEVDKQAILRRRSDSTRTGGRTKDDLM